MSVLFDTLSTRDAFGEALLQMAGQYPNLMYVAADTLKSVGGAQMNKKYPQRAINVGIAEQNMALMGAGMAACGAKAFVASYAVFCSARMCEQVRTFICYPKLDVKIVAGLGGLSGGQEGVTHQGNEDIGILRSIPNLVIVEAADAESTKVITEVITHYTGPVYLRLGRNPSPKVFGSDYRFVIGKANELVDGKMATVVATGAAVFRALEAEKLLRKENFDVRVLEMPCIKPVDAQAIVKAARETGLIVTVEDHNVIGGLGSAVSEVLTDNQPCRLLRIGIDDEFTESGDHEELLDRYNLLPGDIAKRIKNAIEQKR
jgi:transketolase